MTADTDLILVSGPDYCDVDLPAGFGWRFWDALAGGADEARIRMAVVDTDIPREAVSRLSSLPGLRVVQTATLGTDFLPLLADGVSVHNAAGIPEHAAAEACVLGLLVLLRGYQQHFLDAREHRWRPPWESAPASASDGVRGLFGRRVALLGHGGVGQAVAERLRGFGCIVDPYGRTPRDTAAGPVHGIGSLLPRVRDYDIVVVALPATAETRHLVDADLLARMKDGAVVSNVGRGSVIDTDALVAELRRGRIGAALDVTDPEPLPPGHPLWDCPHLVLTPHTGGASDMIRPRWLEFARAQIRAFALGAPLRNRIVRRLSSEIPDDRPGPAAEGVRVVG